MAKAGEGAGVAGGAGLEAEETARLFSLFGRGRLAVRMWRLLPGDQENMKINIFHAENYNPQLLTCSMSTGAVFNPSSESREYVEMKLLVGSYSYQENKMEYKIPNIIYPVHSKWTGVP